MLPFITKQGRVLNCLQRKRIFTEMAPLSAAKNPTFWGQFHAPQPLEMKGSEFLTHLCKYLFLVTPTRPLSAASLAAP